MENAQFNPFKDPEKEGEGYLDFIIKNKNTPIGHIYLTHLQKDPRTQTLKFLEAIEDDNLPFVFEQETSYSLNSSLVKRADFKLLLVLEREKVL